MTLPTRKGSDDASYAPWDQEIIRLRAALTEAEQRAERYREALDFYADPKNWKLFTDEIGSNTNLAWNDEGKVARDALAAHSDSKQG